MKIVRIRPRRELVPEAKQRLRCGSDGKFAAVGGEILAGFCDGQMRVGEGKSTKDGPVFRVLR